MENSFPNLEKEDQVTWWAVRDKKQIGGQVFIILSG